MTEDYEKQQVFAVVCKWKEKDNVDIHISSTVIDYKFHGDISNAIKAIYETVNPINIIKMAFRDKIDISNIEVLDKYIYTCQPVNNIKTEETEINFDSNTSRFDTSFVMPYDVKEE